jgi:hypothetical protein
MPVLGMVMCESLALEFACLLAGEAGIAAITVLEDARSRPFMEALVSRGCRAVECIPHCASFRRRPPGELEIIVRVLGLELHGNKEVLRRSLRAAAGELAARADALLFGYGSCGGAGADPGSALDAGVPVFMPLDRGRPADDCVSICIGGRRRYYAEQRKVPGTFFMTPEWSYQWRKMFRPDFFGGAGNTLLQRLFARYERSLLVVTPAMRQGEMERNAAAFNRLFGLRMEACGGTLAVLSRAWRSARRFLEGK